MSRVRALVPWGLLTTSVAAAVSALVVTTPWRLLRYPLGLRAEAAEPDSSPAGRDWVALAASLHSPKDFRPFEPLLEELAGEPPLTWHAVDFTPASSESTGHYRFWHIDLLGADDPSALATRHPCAEVLTCNELDLCTAVDASGREEVLRGRLLSTWVHEQGHHYARSLLRHGLPGAERRWIEQIEAEALAFAFAERLGQGISRELASNLLLLRLRPATDELLHLREMARERLVDRLPWPDPDEKQAWVAAILVLRGSGLEDFGAVWRFVHGSAYSAVAERIRENVAKLDEGHRAAVQLLFALQGARLSASPGEGLLPSLPDPSLLSAPEALLRGRCLTVRYPRLDFSFCRDGDDAWIALDERSPRRALVRLGTDRQAPCLAALGRSGQAPAFLLIEGRRASVRTISAAPSPCLCRSDERLPSDDEALADLVALGGQLSPLVALAASDVRRLGGPDDEAFADRALFVASAVGSYMVLPASVAEASGR